MIKQFRFEFSQSNNELSIDLLAGCGLSAHNYEDAIELLVERIFPDKEMPVITMVIEDVDIPTLDDAHVRRNIGNELVRGIWFPLGY